MFGVTKSTDIICVTHNEQKNKETLTFHFQTPEKRDLLEYAAAQVDFCLHSTSGTALERLHSLVYHPYSWKQSNCVELTGSTSSLETLCTKGEIEGILVLD